MRTVSALVIVLASGSAFGQGVAEALRAPAKTLGVAELPEGYRAVSLGDSSATISPLYLMGVSSGEGDSQAKLLFSLMGTTFVDPDEFAELLAGKRPRIKGYALDFSATIGAASGGDRTPSPIFEVTWIEAGRIVQWSPRPTLTRAAMLKALDAPRSKDTDQGPMSMDGMDPKRNEGDLLYNVNMINAGLKAYLGDYDMRFPKADSTAVARKAVLPYLRERTVWTVGAKDRILYNTALSGIKLASLDQPSATLVLWQEKPAPDGTRAVGFADGHGETVRADEWKTIWAREEFRRSQKRTPKG